MELTQNSASANSSLINLELLFAEFRTRLQDDIDTKDFSYKESTIIRDIVPGLYANPPDPSQSQEGYKETDPEKIFYTIGGYRGLIALIVYFRKSQAFKTHWNYLSVEHQSELVERVLKLPFSIKSEITRDYYDPHGPYFVGNHGGRRRTRPNITRSQSSPQDDLPDLLFLIGCLGQQALPIQLFSRAVRPQIFYNCSGEAEGIEPITFIPCFENDATMKSAFEDLILQRHLSRNDLELTYEIGPAVWDKIQTKLSVRHDKMHLQFTASRLMFHVFPIDQDLDSKFVYAQIGAMLLPSLWHVAAYLDLHGFVEHFSNDAIQQGLRSCLSGSEFGDTHHKARLFRSMVTMAQHLDHSDESKLLLKRLQHRQNQLSRVYDFRLSWSPPSFSLPSRPGFSIYLAEVMCFDVQLLIDHDNLPLALQKLRTYLPPVNPSEGERRTEQKILLLLTRLYLYAGHFEKAASFIHERDIRFRQLIPSIMAHSSAVLCELGRFEEAASLLPKMEFTGPTLSHGKKLSRRLALTAAGVYLSNGLYLVQSSNLTEAASCFDVARSIYQYLVNLYKANTDLTTSFRFVSVSVGIAMLAHVRCQLGIDNDWEVVESLWQSSSAIINRLRTDPSERSFLHFSVVHSRCHVRATMGHVEEANRLYNEAKTLYGQAGRSFYFLSLGTRWVDLVADWIVMKGLGRISSLACEEYLSRQMRSGWPDIIGSSRLYE